MKQGKQQITVTVTLIRIECSNIYLPKPSEHHKLDVFFSSSRASSKQFKFFEGVADFSKNTQVLQVKNVVGDKIEFWLNATHPIRKLIGFASLKIDFEDSQQVISLKLQNDEFAKLEFNVKVSKRSIQKQIFIQPDEVILRKKIDPVQQLKRIQQQQRRRQKQLQQQQARELALKKRPIITLQTQNKKQQPFT